MSIMTQDELWLKKYQDVKDFMETKQRNPSKYYPKDRDMHNWFKHNRKLLNAGKMKEDRVEMFEKLLELGEKYKRVNQWK